MRLMHFKEDEFNRAIPSCSLSDMNADFMELLDKARYLAGVPFVVNSAYRSSDYDKAKGRTGVGYHTLGRAVDICCTDSMTRSKILLACLTYGLSCGISKTFIHVDNRPNQIAFLY